jgi:hypothetical protein
MDRLYKPLLLRLVKEGMAQHFPAFETVKVVRTQPNADVFGGAQLYCHVAQPDHAAWLTWQPGSGAERCFTVLLGWSPSRAVLPTPGREDRRMYSLRGPSPEFRACSLSLEQVLGRSAIGGFEIPSPWDQLYRLKPGAPPAENKRVMHVAATQAAALSPEDRLAAVRGVTDEVFSTLRSVVPGFLMPAQS